MDIHVLLIDDDKKIGEKIQELLDGEKIEGNRLKIFYISDFEKGLDLLKEKDFDLVILDVFRGKPNMKNSDRPGEKILEQIRGVCFVPVILFTGLVKPVEYLKSNLVRIVRKGSSDDLKKEIKDVFNSQLPFIKKKLNLHIKEVMRKYFWEFIDPEWIKKNKISDEVSLGYLVSRRIANSLSKNQLTKILDDQKIDPDKVHPIEFYVFPPTNAEYETGDILKKGGEFFVILTPSCDFILRGGKRKAKNVLLVKGSPLESTSECGDFKQKNSPENKDKLKRLIEGRRGDRYFFLPGTMFIGNTVLDFQDVFMTPFFELSSYSKEAKIDDPFSQSMLAAFIRYYNRVAHPDIDSDYIIKKM